MRTYQIHQPNRDIGTLLRLCTLEDGTVYFSSTDTPHEFPNRAIAQACVAQLAEEGLIVVGTDNTTS